ncbi:MAG: hypothetical protein IPN86_16645 [Saprospiraceae bacterium]|nr:hypothetical protein [Saprospiraceae bacterium]
MVKLLTPPVVYLSHSCQGLHLRKKFGQIAENVTNLTTLPNASSEDIQKFDDIIKYQMGVAILGGETTKPFYYDHYGKNEEIYKYKKIINTDKIASKNIDYLGKELSQS